MNNTLGVVDLAEGRLVAEVPVGVAPYDVVLSLDEKTAYVSNWGGRRPKAGEKTARSAGTDTLVEDNGSGKSGTVSLIDLTMQKETAQVATGLHPADLKSSRDGQRLYVANANSDTISVIDTTGQCVIETISVRPDEALPFGSASNALALSADESRLFVANGGNNAVAVIRLAGSSGQRAAIEGFIPAGWYPGAVACAGGNLFIANVKGTGSRQLDNKNRAYNSRLTVGSVQKLALPGAAALEKYTRQVRADALVPQALRAWERGNAGAAPVPVPARLGEPSVFEHIVYVIKENRTYDQVFGDIKKGNGQESLCIFPKAITPQPARLGRASSSCWTTFTATGCSRPMVTPGPPRDSPWTSWRKASEAGAAAIPATATTRWASPPPASCGTTPCCMGCRSATTGR